MLNENFVSIFQCQYRQDIFKPTNRNESLHEISNDSGVRVINLAHLKVSQSKARCFHIATFINIRGRLQMEKPTNILTLL
jgi:hypothetical protein